MSGLNNNNNNKHFYCEYEYNTIIMFALLLDRNVALVDKFGPGSSLPCNQIDAI